MQILIEKGWFCMEQPKGDNRRQIIQKMIDERLNVRYNAEKEVIL